MALDPGSSADDILLEVNNCKLQNRSCVAGSAGPTLTRVRLHPRDCTSNLVHHVTAPRATSFSVLRTCFLSASPINLVPKHGRSSPFAGAE